ncbi:uncharacterized protein EAF01_000722 [Botrytis porri]|uniref:Uncharacterized protein n=1 Tax=Botrytis porri TaxID=87229 RepID=A0A4Z1L496_9HELO|nr:uncharacterized protein EAF01_000722 [Botrytis porri]KAF7914316.1 hypothetical protein EAF01_000722 [Botrytis porri]TGO91598.1 hypothetical protein BPOR_0023g00230 [Botrytis porri]
MANSAISDRYMKYVKQLTPSCNCHQNHIVCHHRSSIGASAIQKTKILEETDIGRCECLAIEPTIPPPQPETYTGHLAVLRNPTHREWGSRPHRYLSPTLCNISSCYVKRFVEPLVRKNLSRGEWTGRHEFTMAVVQVEEIRTLRDKGVTYRKEKSKYIDKVNVQRKKHYEFEQQVEILMTKIQEIRWKREKEEELGDFLENLVGCKESAEQKREFEEQKREFLETREKLKRGSEYFVRSMEDDLRFAERSEDSGLVEKIARSGELVLGYLGGYLEEVDENVWRDQEKEREEGVKRKREGGEGVEKRKKAGGDAGVGENIKME